MPVNPTRTTQLAPAPAALRAQLEAHRATVPVRELARRIGIARTALQAVLDGRPTRAKTLARVSAWLEQPAEADSVEEVRERLRRLVGGELGVGRAKKLDAAIARAVAKAYEDGGLEPPPWLRAWVTGEP